MNRYDWNNPPPPGTEFDFPDEDSNVSCQKNDSTRSSDQGTNQIDHVKSPVPQRRENELPVENTQLRSRSKSPERRKRRRRSRSHSRRSRSYSRDRRRRSRSRSRRRRRKFSSSRSRSPSRSPNYRPRHRRHNRRYSRSRSRSHTMRTKSFRSKSGSRSHSRSRSYRDRKSPKSRHAEARRYNEYTDKELDGDIIGEEDMKIEDPDEDAPTELEGENEQGPIPFKNDGSFLEMFKKMQEQQKASEEPPEETASKKPVLPVFGKRRGGKVLKTGMVAKVRNTQEEVNNAQDAWSVYMKEVRKYKEVHCDDDSKTRPLVK